MEEEAAQYRFLAVGIHKLSTGSGNLTSFPDGPFKKFSVAANEFGHLRSLLMFGLERFFSAC